MFFQILLSPHVKRCAIITYKHGIYELPYELLKATAISPLRGLGPQTKPHRMIAQCPDPPAKRKILLIVAKEFQKIAIKPFP